MSRKLPLLLGALGLVVALLVGAVALRFGFRYYLEANAVRLDPLGLAAYGNETPSPPSETPRLVMFGDSRILMWGTPRIPGYEVVNHGISHQTTAQLLGRFEQDVTQHRPNVVLLQLGINDLKTIPLFPEREAEIVASTIRNTQTIVERCSALGAEVLLVTVFQVGEPDLLHRPFWNERVAVAVRKVNDALRELAGEHVRVLPAERVLEQAGALRPEFSADLLHLTPTAYAALTKELLLPALTRQR